MAHVQYISASCNRFPSAASKSNGSLIAFGSGRLIAMWNPDEPDARGVHRTLPSHEGLVTALCFFAPKLFVSGDDKGTLKIWTNEDERWLCSATATAHTGPVSVLTCYEGIVVTGSSDGTVKIWKPAVHGPASDNSLEELQTIKCRGKLLPLAIAVGCPSGSEGLILAVGGTDRIIDIWTGPLGKFTHAVALPGHEDWVRGLSFRPARDHLSSLTLASGSADSTIRLWNINPVRATKGTKSESQGIISDEMLESFEASFKDLADTDDSDKRLSMKRYRITTRQANGAPTEHDITFDALLIGHEAAITSVTWSPAANADDSAAALLSTSTDSSVILWAQITISAHEKSTSLWTNHQRFGDVGGQRLGGFVGGIWDCKGSGVFAWGWNGGWRRWHSVDNTTWQEVAAISGHNAPVRGLAWSPNGEYLLSAGLDQTTRLHAELKSVEGAGAWREISRPQVHGYDLLDGVFLSPLRFTSIGDEKVVRLFDAPQSFITLAGNLLKIQLNEGQESRPVTASVPPLGLSNKATTDGSSEAIQPFLTESRAPFEGELASVTLWPESEKIFGHGYELMAIAVSHSKHLIATACKATTAEHAVIRLYDTQTWQPYSTPLAGHNLTITRIAFSHDDQYILSVSRDRTWRLYYRTDGGYKPVASDKSHARVIWDCAWTFEGHIFATASRDKTVSIWQVPPGEVPKKWTSIAKLQLSDAATAVAFHRADAAGRTILAVGLETGHIHIFKSNPEDLTNWNVHCVLDSSVAHVDHIYQLEWRPDSGGIGQLASCSDDGTLKILEVHM